MGRWRSFGYHLAAILLGTAVGIWSMGEGTEQFSRLSMEQMSTTVLRVRGTGYASLVLLGLALAIGPLARFWPKGLSRLLPWRRAVGIWSALAGGLHLYFVWILVTRQTWEFYRKPILQHFLTTIVFPDGGSASMLSLQTSLSLVMWLGLIALSIMTLIALVSNDPAQRFLGQSRWKLIQQQAYTAFLFAALHILVMQYAGKMKGNPPLIAGVTWFLLAIALLQSLGFLITVWRYRRRAGARSDL